MSVLARHRQVEVFEPVDRTVCLSCIVPPAAWRAVYGVCQRARTHPWRELSALCLPLCRIFPGILLDGSREAALRIPQVHTGRRDRSRHSLATASSPFTSVCEAGVQLAGLVRIERVADCSSDL